MTDRIVIDVSRDGWTGRLQLGISQLSSQRGETDRGSGLRLSGPKFNGSSERLLRFEVDKQDAEDIRKFLNVVDPQPNQPSRAEVLREAADAVAALIADGEHDPDCLVDELRRMADTDGQGEQDTPEPEPLPYTEARAAFMQIGTTHSLEGLRTELHIEGHPPLVGSYCGAGMRRSEAHDGVLFIEPMLAFEYAAPAEGGDAE